MLAMQDYRLDKQKLAELRAAHRAARNAREAYRLNAVILLGSGWSPSEVAAALLIDDDTVRNHFKRYQQGGIAALERMNYGGSEALLTPTQLAELDAHLQQELHSSAASVARSVKERFGVHYTDSGMTAYLEHSRIDLQFLPPYAPNLNLIERFWKFFKRQVLYNRYYETFADYKAACNQFFADLNAHADQLRSLLTENFEIIRGY
jgi:transposase